MTNLQKWQSYLSDIISPDQYIEAGYYYMISAALQRRVFCGPEHLPIYPNQFTILTGEPGIGKGLVIRPVTKILKSFLLPDPREKSIQPQSDDKLIKVFSETVQMSDYKAAQELEEENARRQSEKKAAEKPLLIPVAADATTYEALIRQMARSIRSITIKKWSEDLQKWIPDIYTHTSLCFCLEEISSLFRKHTEDVVHFLQQAYDCGDYTYDTKNRGRDGVKNCCLNFFGGAQPAFMSKTFDDFLISEGFSSRTFFIFAAKNRDRPFWNPPLTIEQKSYLFDITLHVEKLTKLYGHVDFTQEANEFLEDWWKNSSKERPNTNPKLIPYYGRKKVHVLKLSMAKHFGESTEMLVQKSTVVEVLKYLASVEKLMHFCLGLDNDNPLSKLSGKVEKFIAYNNKEYSFNDLLAEFWESIPGSDQKESLQSVLEHLEATNKIIIDNKPHPITKNMMRFYVGMKQSII